MATEYVVLQEVGLPDNTRGWILFGGTIEASSNEAAVRRAVKDREHGGIFCAVPKRSWAPLEVNVKVERSMSVGEPGQFSEPEPAPLETDDQGHDEEHQEPEGDPLDATLPPPENGDGPEAEDDEIAAAVARGELPADAGKPNREKQEGARY